MHTNYFRKYDLFQLILTYQLENVIFSEVICAHVPVLAGSCPFADTKNIRSCKVISISSLCLDLSSCIQLFWNYFILNLNCWGLGCTFCPRRDAMVDWTVTQAHTSFRERNFKDHCPLKSHSVQNGCQTTQFVTDLLALAHTPSYFPLHIVWITMNLRKNMATVIKCGAGFFRI